MDALFATASEDVDAAAADLREHADALLGNIRIPRLQLVRGAPQALGHGGGHIGYGPHLRREGLQVRAQCLGHPPGQTRKRVGGLAIEGGIFGVLSDQRCVRRDPLGGVE